METHYQAADLGDLYYDSILKYNLIGTKNDISNILSDLPSDLSLINNSVSKFDIETICCLLNIVFLIGAPRP